LRRVRRHRRWHERVWSWILYCFSAPVTVYEAPTPVDYKDIPSSPAIPPAPRRERLQQVAKAIHLDRLVLFSRWNLFGRLAIFWQRAFQTIRERYSSSRSARGRRTRRHRQWDQRAWNWIVGWFAGSDTLYQTRRSVDSNETPGLPAIHPAARPAWLQQITKALHLDRLAPFTPWNVFALLPISYQRAALGSLALLLVLPVPAFAALALGNWTETDTNLITWNTNGSSGDTLRLTPVNGVNFTGSDVVYVFSAPVNSISGGTWSENATISAPFTVDAFTTSSKLILTFGFSSDRAAPPASIITSTSNQFTGGPLPSSISGSGFSTTGVTTSDFAFVKFDFTNETAWSTTIFTLTFSAQ
jgi:hypothetical protein